VKFLNICSFELSGHFASFRKPDVNKVYLTYNNPPYAAILGIFGSIIGLSGYSPKKKHDPEVLPQFYENLSGIWFSFRPVFSKRPIFLKQMVTYNNYHGYGSDAGCFQITEQILIKPSWEIFLFDEDGKHADLIENIKNKKTVFTPYLGKNEFRAEIGELKEFEATEITDKVATQKAMKFDSIVLLNRADKHPVEKKLSKGIGFANLDLESAYISEDGYSIFENYPYALDKTFHYKFCLSAFTNWEIDTSRLMNGTRTFRIKSNDDKEGKERVINMFNGGVG